MTDLITQQPTFNRFEPPAPWTRLTRGAIARTLVRLLVRDIPVRLRLADGTVLGGGADNAPLLEALDEKSLFTRLESQPKLGLGESYMAGEWRAGAGTDLADALAPFAPRLATILPRPLLAMRVLVDRAHPAHHRNDARGARANIEAHYDLSNDLFGCFLDPSMTYSSAIFDSTSPWPEQDLHAAQLRKIDAALDAAGVGNGTRLLEIGSGWGALAIRAAQRGARVTTLTLSEEQRDHALRAAEAAGVSALVDIRLQDYREITGNFDAIVSIEMIEAVGAEFWPDYFGAIDSLLAPGGTAVVQAILMSHERYLATRHSYGWIQKHIFPGGLIPSLQAIDEVTRGHTNLRVTGSHHFGKHYAHTLRRWRTAFVQAAPRVSSLGFDATFQRMWEFYLAYSEAGFASGYLDVAQISLSRGADQLAPPDGAR